VAPRLRGPDGKVQLTCRSFPGPDVVHYEALGLSRLFPRSRVFGKYRMSWWGYDDARPVDQPMASALLVRSAALDEIGLFDEQFPMFFNDVDLCRRLWDAGWEVWFTPAAEMTHLGGAATRQVRREMIIESHRSFLAYYRKRVRGRTNAIAYGMAVLLLKVGQWVRLASHT
jgi:GT2 family glycosyltransferase